MARIGKSAGLILLLFISAVLRAGTLTGELDKPEGSIEDQFVYTLSIQGKGSGTLNFPEIPGVAVQQAGTSQSVSVINGEAVRETQYQFLLTPTKEGTYAIPSIQLTVDGKTQQTLPIEFKVTAAAQGPRSDKPIFMERTVSKERVYVGESVLASIKVYNRVRMLGAKPDFRYPDAFQEKKLDGERNYRKVIDGQDYEVTEINSILIPTKAGKVEIPAATLDVRYVDNSKPRRRGTFPLEDLWGVGNSTEKRFRSSPTNVEILPLPVNGRRGDFSGLVGEFKGRADLSTADLKVGETATLTLIIEGHGATGGMAEPNFNLGDKAKIYRDKPQSQDSYDAGQGVLGQRSFKIAIVPRAPGDLDLGTLKIQYFNTSVGQYQDMVIPLGTLHVSGTAPAPASTPAPTQPLAPAAKAEPTKPAPAEVRSLASDLLEPHAIDRLSGTQSISQRDIIAGAGLLLLSLGCLGLGCYRSWIRGQGVEREARKKAGRALKNASKQLTEARSFLDKQDVEAAVGLAQNSIRQYLGDKFSIRGSALTLRDLEKQLQQHGLAAPTIESMRQIWQNLDQLRFAAAGADPSRGRDVLQKVDQLLLEVEQRCASS